MAHKLWLMNDPLIMEISHCNFEREAIEYNFLLGLAQRRRLFSSKLLQVQRMPAQTFAIILYS